MSDNNKTIEIDHEWSEVLKADEKKDKSNPKLDHSDYENILRPRTAHPIPENINALNIRHHRHQASEIYNTNPAFLMNDMMLAYETLCYMVKNKKSLSIVEQPGSGKTFFLQLLEGLTTLYPFEIYSKLFNKLTEKDRMILNLNKIAVINLDLKSSHTKAKRNNKETEDRILYYLSEDFDNQIRRKVAFESYQIDELNKMKKEREREAIKENPNNIQAGLHKQLLAYLMDEVYGGFIKKIVYSSLDGAEIAYNSEEQTNDEDKVEQIINKLEQDPNITKTTQNINHCCSSRRSGNSSYKRNRVIGIKKTYPRKELLFTSCKILDKVRTFKI